MQRTPSQLLCRLFDYAEESLKELEPSRYQLSSPKNEVFTPGFLSTLPGLHFDQQLPGDSIWLQIDRLEETRSPRPSEGEYHELIKLSENPRKLRPSRSKRCFNVLATAKIAIPKKTLRELRS